MSDEETPLLSRLLIHTATMLVVDDLDRSVAYYRDRFGFVVREHESSIALLAFGSMQLYLITESSPTADKPSVTLSNTNTVDRTGVNLVFRVSDCQAVYEDLQQRGVEFLTPPQFPSWGGWRCFARDPDGYLIEIEQP
jgi:catechol 2,3-dioxygenase-like lactoylglutathione lyase family enzyme